MVTIRIVGARRELGSLYKVIMQILSGLQFPEGPVAMPDGSIILVEIARETPSRITPDGRVEVIANIPGGPNGAALGPRQDVRLQQRRVRLIKERGTHRPSLQSETRGWQRRGCRSEHG